ncbi:glucuronate isomerase [Marinomonas sp. 2405UD68-3]|uniref:glucuronate isomerase n=1 Tax=Marinomonas sp. 2405UD68-3 TaxID=3391835 RepID=UPI0039C99B6B
MCDDFLLKNETAKRLYHDFAKSMPIYDYHCHLNVEEIANNRQFENLGQIWLEGDHYKWRAMRTAGVVEHLITGEACDYDKYMAWAKTVPKTIGNPLYHWTHLELRRPFSITDRLLNPENAESIWHDANGLLARSEFSARGIMQQMNVVMVGSTDDPTDSLLYHKILADDESFHVDVVPSWRPDRVINIEADGFPSYMEKLSEASGIDINSYDTFLLALDQRIQHFSEHGCRAADHGMEIVRYAEIPSTDVLNGILTRRLSNGAPSEKETAQFATAVHVYLGKCYAKLGWAMQMHIGAQRNNRSRMLSKIGRDSGFDSMADRPYAFELGALLNEMDKTDELPKTILYCLNPRDNEMIATMVGNFQGGGLAGKIQFGSGWWFNDQKDGMERQIQQLSQLGLLSQFVGMLTDSRSLLSYTRHEYFRRILCNMIGQWVEDGEAPNDMGLLSKMIEDICFNNAKAYFMLPNEK